MRKTKTVLVLLIFLSIMLLTVHRINTASDRYAETTVKNTVYKQVNDAIYKYVESNNEAFSKAVKHDYDDSGALVCISLNAATINAIKSGLEEEIISTIDKLESVQFYMSAGSLSGIKFFSQKGPKIKMLIAPLGTLSCTAINTFDSVGMNHTLHKVGYEFCITFSAAAPFYTSSFETKFTVLICETIIVGKVPSVYVN